MNAGYQQFYLNLPDSHALAALLREINVPYAKRGKRPDLLIAEIAGDLSVTQSDAIVGFFSASSNEQLWRDISYAEISLLINGSTPQLTLPPNFVKCALDLGIEFLLRYSRYDDGVPGVPFRDEFYEVYADMLADGPLRNIVHVSYHHASSGMITGHPRWSAGEVIPELSAALSGLSRREEPPLPNGWIRIQFRDFTRFFLGPILTETDLALLGVSDPKDIRGVEFICDSMDI